MFSCAWSTTANDVHRVRTMFLDHIPYLLPCSICRENYAKHVAIVNRRTHGEPDSVDRAFLWCWHMKDQVNRITHDRSISMTELVERYIFHGPALNEVEVADCIMLMALTARILERDDLFVAFCSNLATILPVPDDSALKQHLSLVARPITQSTLRCVCRTRQQHNQPVRVLTHYKEMLS